MLSPETTTGAFGSTTKSVPVVMNARADCTRCIGAVKGALTAVTIRSVANKRKVIVVTEVFFLLLLLRLCIISSSVKRDYY